MANAGPSIYKRDQVERAIAIVSGISPQHGPKRFGALKVELKRLLERDRKQALETPRGKPESQAFHDGPPPGRGFDVMYTGYEAFALLIALRLMRGGLTQGTAVNFMLEVRPRLESFHSDTLAKALEELCPEVKEGTRLSRLIDGFLVRDPKMMVYLVARAGDDAEVYDLPSPPDAPVSGNVCHGEKDLLDRMREASHKKYAVIVVELVNAAHQLAHHLKRIPARSRGRQ